MADGEKPHPLEERTGGVRSASMRKLARDGKTWTPTEKRTRDRLMKQFCRLESGGGNSEEYRRRFDLIDWTNGGTR